ncbi:MAG: phosphotransferase [Kouleothrix sp.]|nr:phosphotransferase [Kouleothrix sp.]
MACLKTQRRPIRHRRRPGGAGLRQIAPLPEWLVAIGRPERVIEALSRHVPELATGALTLQSCKIKHLGLDDDIGCWTGEYTCTIEGPAQRRSVQLRGILAPPGGGAPDSQPSAVAFGAAGWRCYLPELRLELQTRLPEPELPALPLLTDPDQARALLEQSIRAGSPAYRDIRIQSCEPDMARSHAAVRHVLRYKLAYPLDAPAGHSWPPLVVAKTYDSDLGQNAYASMRALWESPLRSSGVVTIAEPLAYMPELKILVQGPVREQQTLEDMLETAIRSDSPAALDELQSFMQKAAAGLAALHQSGVSYGRPFTWLDRLAQARAALAGLVRPLPEFARAVEPTLARLEARAAETPPDPAVPAHGAFRAAQVLIDHGQIGLIDFDGFCQAEPAMDLARFSATAKDVGLEAALGKADGDDPATQELRLRRLLQIEALCAAFTAQYEALAPVSRERIALWEALNILTLVMASWKKVKPARLRYTLLMLERLLSSNGLD